MKSGLLFVILTVSLLFLTSACSQAEPVLPVISNMGHTTFYSGESSYLVFTVENPSNYTMKDFVMTLEFYQFIDDTGVYDVSAKFLINGTESYSTNAVDIPSKGYVNYTLLIDVPHVQPGIYVIRTIMNFMVENKTYTYASDGYEGDFDGTSPTIGVPVKLRFNYVPAIFIGTLVFFALLLVISHITHRFTIADKILLELKYILLKVWAILNKALLKK